MSIPVEDLRRTLRAKGLEGVEIAPQRLADGGTQLNIRVRFRREAYVPLDGGAVHYVPAPMGEGAHREGAHEKGVHEEGVHGEGTHGAGAHEEGAHGAGAHEEGAHEGRPYDLDDLSVIPGIGPVRLSKLHKAGYYTFTDLDAAPDKDLLRYVNQKTLDSIRRNAHR